MSNAISLRAGRRSDEQPVLALWDGAIAWLVARGQTGQWGSEPASASPQRREMARTWTQTPGLTIAEIDEQVVGMSVLLEVAPEYAPPIKQSERYLLALLSSREHIGMGIGGELVRRAVAETQAAGEQVLRVDCWADAPGLVAWYESQGFKASGTFLLNEWRGQLLEMQL